jgi:hypothetical protein
MREAVGDIWKLSGAMDYVVVPTSICWKHDGTAVLGRGLAFRAVKRWPLLAMLYGEQCQIHGAATPVLLIRPPGLNPKNLLLFPVKPLNPAAPHLSWQAPADIGLVIRSLQQLAALIPTLPKTRDVYVPDVGCGNGMLPVVTVRPLIEQHLRDLPNAVHVRAR